MPTSLAKRIESLPTGRGDLARPSVLVVGLGNPILGDDGVGWSIARQVADHLVGNKQVEVDCLSVGGLSLMERMLGYQHVILIDAVDTGRSSPGTTSILGLGDLLEPGIGHSASAHDASLITALASAEAMGASVPERVDIVAVEARVGFEFTEALSTPVAAAVPGACASVLELIDR